MDLSKPFNTINHELLIAESHVYGFSIEAPEVLLNYLQERWQRVKINKLLVHVLNYFKEFHKDRFLVPCGLIFTSMINEIDICNFADDTTRYF